MRPKKMKEHTTQQMAAYDRRACVDAQDLGTTERDGIIEYSLRHFAAAPVFFYDHGKTGRLLGREGLVKLMAEVVAGKVRAVVIRNVSVLGRDLVDLVFIAGKLQTLGVELHSLQNGGPISMPMLLLEEHRAPRLNRPRSAAGKRAAAR